MPSASKGENTYRYTVGDTLADVGPVVLAADRDAGLAGVDDERRNALQVCLEEALANLAMHGQARGASKDITVDLAVLPNGQVTMTVCDSCVAFSPIPAPQKPPESDSPGGRGIRLLHAFSQNVRYWTEGERNFLEISI